MKGVIKTLIQAKGFGFITPEGEANAKDLFFHSNDMVKKELFDSLKGGETVTFEVEVGPKGPNAKNVEVVS